MRWWDSIREAEEWLGHQHSVVRLGCGADNDAAWLSGVARGVLLFLCLAWRAPGPQVAETHADAPLVVGANTSIYWVARASATRGSELLGTTDLGTPFYEFVSVDPEGVVSVFETGVAKVTPSGDSVWRVDTDRISDYHVQGREMKLLFEDDAPVAIDLGTGLLL
jgi:hypothetical protein